LLINSELLMDPEGIISFCRERFEQTRKLVENTHSGRIIEDFPRYTHVTPSCYSSSTSFAVWEN
jgi:hypothetical protein